VRQVKSDPHQRRQAEAGDIVLLYGNESEALTHPTSRMPKKGADLRVPAPGQAKKVALLGSFVHAIRELVVHTSPTKSSSDFIAHLEQLGRLYGPRLGQPFTPRRAGRGQRPDPHQQARARSPRRPRPFDAGVEAVPAASLAADTSMQAPGEEAVNLLFARHGINRST
jgi:hypothetical protein